MRRTAIVIILLIILLLSGCADYRTKYDELYDQYIELESKAENERNALEDKIDSIYSDIWKTSDPIATLSMYFDNDGITFEEASEAFDELHSILHKHY